MMYGQKITTDELWALFGDELPIEVAQFIFVEAPPTMKVSEVRARITEMALETRKKRNADLVRRLRTGTYTDRDIADAARLIEKLTAAPREWKTEVKLACPECDSPLITISTVTLQGSRQGVCKRCGFVAGAHRFRITPESEAEAVRNGESPSATRTRLGLGPFPDDVVYEYLTKETGRKTGVGHADAWPEGEGWEIDTTRGRPGEGWERFDNHEELYFRRPIATAAKELFDAERNKDVGGQPVWEDLDAAQRQHWISKAIVASAAR